MSNTTRPLSVSNGCLTSLPVFTASSTALCRAATASVSTPVYSNPSYRTVNISFFLSLIGLVASRLRKASAVAATAAAALAAPQRPTSPDGGAS